MLCDARRILGRSALQRADAGRILQAWLYVSCRRRLQASLWRSSPLVTPPRRPRSIAPPRSSIGVGRRRSRRQFARQRDDREIQQALDAGGAIRIDAGGGTIEIGATLEVTRDAILDLGGSTRRVVHAHRGFDAAGQYQHRRRQARRRRVHPGSPIGISAPRQLRVSYRAQLR
jgi:hypothetical protein